MRRLFACLLVFASFSYGFAKSGFAQSTVGAIAAPTINITISPTTVQLAAGVSQQFVGTVTNDFLSAGLTWTLSGPSCSGATCGTLSPVFQINGMSATNSLSASSITYTAPATPPSIPTVILTATSIQDSSKFVNATISLTTNPPPVTQNNVVALTSQTSASVNIFPINGTIGNSIGVWPTVPSADTISGVFACTVTTATPATNSGCTALTLKDTATNATGAFSLFVYVGLAIPAGQNFIEVTNSAASGTIGLAYADITNGSVFDTSSHSNNLSGANPSGPAITPATVQEFVATAIATTGTVSAISSPFTLSNGSAGFGLALGSTVTNASGTINPSFTATAGNAAAISLALKPAAASGAPISVALSPATSTVQTTGTQIFTCTVANDTANAGCNITYTGTGCSGATCGTGPASAASGANFTYTAPASVPGGGGSAITKVQAKELNCSPANGPACTMSIAATIGGATDLQCVTLSWGGPASGTASVTDNKTGGTQTYTSILSAADYNKFCVYGGAAGVTQIQAAVTSTPNLVDMYYEEYTGISSGTPDQTASATFGAGTTTFDSGSTPVTTNAADLLMGFAKNGSANTFTVGGDGQGDTYANKLQGGFNGSAIQSFFPTTATHAFKSIMTTDVGGLGEAFVIAWKGSAGGGASTPVQITATSVTDSTKSDSTTVTIQTAAAPISVTVAPTSASVQVSTTQNFTPTIARDGGTNTVTWTLTQNGTACSPGCGAVSPTTTASGAATTYTAPASPTSNINLTATDVTDTTKSATVSIVVTGAPGPFACTIPNCPAFPGAQGGGADSQGGRGGVVMNVTTLSDSVASHCAPYNSDSTVCTYRDCLTQASARTCVFRVAGLITPISPRDGGVQVNNPFLTVAGQTAPGQIIIGGPGNSGFNLRVSTHDVIVRYLTFSPDDINQDTGPSFGTVGAIVANTGATGVTLHDIWDHNTFRWAGNKAYSCEANFNDQVCSGITNQWFLFYEADEGHPVGPSSSQGDNASRSSISFNVDFHHGMVVNVDHRIPEFNNKSNRWENIITFNWSGYAVQAIGATNTDIVNNIWATSNLTPGSSGPYDPHPIHSSDGNISGSNPGTPSWYISGNIGVGHTTPNANQTGDLAVQTNGEGGQFVGPWPGAWVRTTPLPGNNPYPIVPDPAVNLPTLLPPTVGNSQHLSCSGSPVWVTHRDAADSRIIRQYQTNGSGGFYPNGVTFTGLANPPQPLPNWQDSPVVNGTACVETAHDGIPDAWKAAHGFAVNSTPMNNQISVHTGLTMLEVYLSGQQP